MSRRLLTVLLLLVLLGLAARTDAGRVIGKVADMRRDVYGEGPEEPRKPLATLDAVKELMLVQTGKLSAALITIGDRVGAVGLGPESTLKFNQVVVDLVTGAAEQLDFFTQVGQFRFVFMPKHPRKAAKVLGLAPGRVVINTPKRPIILNGTDVYLTVAPNGDTVVYVAEGAVIVGEVQVDAGQWTQLVGDEPPTVPVSFHSGAGTRPELGLGGIEQSALPDSFLPLLGPRPILDLPR
jgi:hypothetical protein